MRVVLALVASVGCSPLAVRGPRTMPTGQVVCESTYVPPAIDTAIAVAGVTMIGYGVATRDDGNGEGYEHTYDEARLYMLGGVLLAVPFAIAAGWGVTTVSRCKNAAR